MFRFSIRELMMMLVVGTLLGWWVDHRAQRTTVQYYTEHYRNWRERVNLLDDMLTELGLRSKVRTSR